MVSFVSLRLDFSDMFEYVDMVVENEWSRNLNEPNGNLGNRKPMSLRGQRWGCPDQISEARDGVRLVRTRQLCTVLFSGTACPVIG